ncbi:MAG: hypothetical protein GC164_02520 [Phycisphaera sp.]|nr:hypothetical protein [Phycisphaera sp.]
MVELSRTVRFCLNDACEGENSFQTPRDNTFSAWPAMRGLGRYYELHVECRGEADPVTGYFMNITQIDAAVRDHALPMLEKAVRDPSRGPTDMGTLMRSLLHTLRKPLDGHVHRVTLNLTPSLSLTIGNDPMPNSATPSNATVIIKQAFEFAAAHRLHVDRLSDDENRKVFGKCNNPAGHGHNYRLEVAVRLPISPDGGVLQPEQLDAWVNRNVIEVFDHKHLNTDLPAFKDRNPSVENIADVIHKTLSEHTSELGESVALDSVSVWETSKTVCTVRG